LSTLFIKDLLALQMFSKVVYLNLDRRADRRRRVEAMLDASDVKSVPRYRVTAVDGAKLTDAELFDMLTPVAAEELLDVTSGSMMRTHHSQLTRGAVGCYLTHRRVWEDIGTGQDTDLPVLVLEDDSLLPANVGALLHTGILQFLQLPEPKLLMLTAYYCDGSGPRISPNEPVRELSKPWWSTQAYAVTPLTARRLASHPDLAKLDIQIDSALQFLPDIAIVTCSRFAAANDGSTNIQARIIKDATLFRNNRMTTGIAPLLLPPLPPLPPVSDNPKPPCPSPLMSPATIALVVFIVVVVVVGLGLGLGLGLGTKSTPTG
jgi:GR25 family glycosyltransferase involved in LPS biosynthesis